MVAAAVLDIGLMLLSAVLSAGLYSALMTIVITGAIPVLAIATVAAVESGVKRRSVWPRVRRGGELGYLAARLRGGRGRIARRMSTA